MFLAFGLMQNPKAAIRRLTQHHIDIWARETLPSTIMLREWVLDLYAGDPLPSVKIFGVDSFRSGLQCRSAYQSIPETDLRLFFNARRSQYLGRGRIGAPHAIGVQNLLCLLSR